MGKTRDIFKKIRDIKGKKRRKAKWLSREDFQIAVKRRGEKQRRKGKT